MSNRINLLEFGDFLLDTSQKALRRDGERVPMSPRPMAMLLILIENRHRIVSHDELMERVWDGVVVEESNIATNIARLRRALTNGQGKNGNGDSRQFIETVSGYGYQFVAEVCEVESEASQMEIEPVAKTIPESEPPPTDNPSLNPPARLLPKPDAATPPPIYRNWRFWIGLAAMILAAYWLSPKSVFIDPSKIRHSEVVSWEDRFEDRELLIRPSQNGLRLAYPKSEGGQSHIFIQDIGKQRPTRVTDDEWPDYDPIWSPDSLQIAYQSRRDNMTELAVIDLLSHRREVLRTFDLKHNYQLLRWSDKAHKLFFTDSKNIFAFFPETGETTNLTNFKEEIDGPSQFGLSLDEEKIAYTKKLNGKKSLFVSRIDGNQEKLLAKAGEAPADPEWFSDNKHIVYACRYAGFYQTAIIGINNDEPIVLTSSPEAAYPYHLSPDGKRIFYVIQRGEGDIYQYSLNTKAEQKILLNTGVKGWLDISRTGKAVAFQKFESFSSSLNGKIFQALLGNDQSPGELTANGFDPRWSPNGKGLAFMRNIEEVTGSYQLYLMEAENTAPRLLSKDIVLQQGFMTPTQEWQQPNNYSWSPDGSQLVFSTRKGGVSNLSAIGIDGQINQARSQNNDPKMKVLSPIWSPNGTNIMYLAQAATTGKASRSLVVNDGTTDRTIFQTESPLRMIGWEENTHFLVGLMEPRRFMLGELALKRLSMAGKDSPQEVIGQALPIYLQSLKLSPDARTLAFTARQNDCDNIWLYSLKTRELTQLTKNTEKHYHLTGLVWLPDGSALCYSKQSTSTVIKAMELFN